MFGTSSLAHGALGHGPYDLPVSSATGTFALTGQSATLASSFIFPASPGSFSLTGEDVGFWHGVGTVSADAGEFTLTGNAASLVAVRTIGAETCSISLTGVSAALARTRIMNSGVSQYYLNGLPVRLSWSGETPQQFNALSKPPNSKIANAKTGIISNEWDTFLRGITERLNALNSNSLHR